MRPKNSVNAVQKTIHTADIDSITFVIWVDASHRPAALVMPPTLTIDAVSSIATTTDINMRI
jgi:hypothetical protein